MLKIKGKQFLQCYVRNLQYVVKVPPILSSSAQKSYKILQFARDYRNIYVSKRVHPIKLQTNCTVANFM